MRVIVLTSDEAGRVRGFSPSTPGHALIPVPMDDGRYKLGPGVLDDPAYAHVRDYLAALPMEEDQPAAELTEEETAAAAPARLTVWSEDQPQKQAVSPLSPTR